MKVLAIYTDGSKLEADAGPRSHVMTERHFDKGMGELFDVRDGKLPRAEYAYYLTWAALRAAGLEPEDDYEKWLDKISDAGLSDDEDDENEGKATRKAPSRKRSSS